MPEGHILFGPKIPLLMPKTPQEELTWGAELSDLADKIVHRVQYAIAVYVPDLKGRSEIPDDEVDVRPMQRQAYWPSKAAVDVEVEIRAFWSEAREREAGNVVEQIKRELLQILPAGTTLFVSFKLERGAMLFAQQPSALPQRT